MNKIQCIIIEDERAAQEILISFLSRTNWFELKGTFEDGISAMKYLKTNDIDLIFLDIQIPGLTGIDLIGVLRNPPQIIITSAYSEFALQAFELDVRDYLMKPFSFERFIKAVNKIAPRPEPSQIHQIAETQNLHASFAFFNVNKKMVRVQFADILFVESMREYVSIHTEKEKIITKMGIAEIEKMLGEGFIRTHRSFVVNNSKITAYSAEEIFINKIAVPIGPNYKKAVELTLGKTM